MPTLLLVTFLLFTTLHTLTFSKQIKSNRCNKLDPKCGLTPAEAQRKFLTTYSDLLVKLENIKQNSKVPISVGPLIRNNGNNGLLNIDVPLDQTLAPVVNTNVCGPENPIPSIRDAIICTVTRDTVAQPPRGNTDATKIGSSTQGKVLQAVRLGNPQGSRVFVVTQQHGNEAASTESALTLLEKLTTESKFARKILANLDLLFLLRANPDGGEPTGNNQPPVGVPYTETTGFFRHNVDPNAGGGFALPSESGFLGVVGRGYDLNRYNYGGLDFAIRPVESQAMVAAVHAFRPDVLFDLHGDAQKVLCELDPATLKPGAAAGILPTVECKPPAQPVPTLLTQRKSMVVGGFFADDATVLTGNNTESLKSGALFRQRTRLVRSIAAEIAKKVDPVVVGTFSRFNAILTSDPTAFTDGTLDRTAMTLSGVGSGWEVANFGPDIRPAVSSVSIVDGKPTPELALDTSDIEPCFLQDNICIHELLLKQALAATVKLINRTLLGDSGYCTIPLDVGNVLRLPASAGFPPELAAEENIMVPSGGQFGVPVDISGMCAGDQ